jgi:glutaminase
VAGDRLSRTDQAMRDQADRGRVADYIPQLAKVDGREFASGDAAEPFSIQSISKVFALTMALSSALRLSTSH